MPFYNFESLENTQKVIFDTIKQDWLQLLEGSHPENVYQQFLQEHSGFFFFDFNCYLTLSKLKLGSEYEADFINITDKRSNGIEYEFIKIEKPSSQLFTKSGVPAKELNNALQQVRDWKRFLIDDKSFFRKFLPTQSTRVITNSFLKFTIIIGRRTENAFINDKRNQIAAETNVQIRSFDYLTDLLEATQFYNYVDREEMAQSELDGMQIENPFSKAVTDSEWKTFCRGQVNTSHFFKNNRKQIAALRKNNSRFSQFKK